MRKIWLVGCFVLLFASPSLAQQNLASQWTCAKPSEAHSLNVGDQANHTYAITTGTCTLSKANALQEKMGTGWNFNDTTGGTSASQGVFVSTTASGDKIFYNTLAKYTVKSGLIQSGNLTWSLAGGTGKFAKTTGQGTCTATGSPDGTVVYNCTGTYTS